jgi:hypothetical protein
MIEAHLRNVATGSDALTFEVYAHWARNEESRRAAHEWYEWLANHYAELLGTLLPETDPGTRRERALQVITLCLGSWLTLGRSRPNVIGRSAKGVRRCIQDGIDRILGVALPWEPG